MDSMTGTAARENKTDWLGVIVTLLTLAWIVGVSFVLQLSAWVMSASPGQFLQRPDISVTTIYFAAAIGQALVLLLPLLPLALLWRTPRYRAAFRAWLAAAIFLLVLAPARLVPSTMPQLALLVQFALMLVFSSFLWLVTGRGKILKGASNVALALAVTLGILFAVPWLLWGALGSVGDILFGILSACAFALASILIATRLWLSGMAQASRGSGWDVTLGGLVIGGMLLVMGSAIGFSGTQILLMVALSSLGWLLMDLTQVDLGAMPWNDVSLFVLVALVAAAPLLLLDPDAGVLLASVGQGEIFAYATTATALTVVGALTLGVVFFLLRKQTVKWRRSSFAWASAAVLAVLALALYFTVGQPGLFGDRVFVILKNQTDVSAAQDIPTYNERRAVVYNTLTQHAQQSQNDLRTSLDRFGIEYTPYYLMNALEVSADLPVQWWLATRGEVDRVLPSPRMRPLPELPPISSGERTSPPSSPDWNLKLIGADRVWQDFNARGQGVVVGQSDSGVDGAHPEFAAQYRGREGANDYNWFDPWNYSASPQDFGGHGTHTLGSILGKNVGVAPDAEWIGCVNLARNLGNPALYLDCMQFNFAPFPQMGDPLRDGKPELGAMVLNNSWGCPEVEGCDAEALLPAVRALREAGVFVVASAGNDGPSCSSINSPLALYDDVFSVAAMNERKQLADFSSRGPVIVDDSGRVKPDIGAPGVDVLSALPQGTYGENSGTSMAGPHIVGVVALMWSANPKLIGDIDTTEQILRETAQRVNVGTERIVCGDPNATPNDFVGYGIVDAYAAVKKALEMR